MNATGCEIRTSSAFFPPRASRRALVSPRLKPSSPRVPTPSRARRAGRRPASRVDARPGRADPRVRAPWGSVAGARTTTAAHRRRRRIAASGAIASTAAKRARRPDDARAPATTPSTRPARESDPADDCETPLEAYRRVRPRAREARAQRLKIPPSELRVWDPYYCGAVARYLASSVSRPVRNDPVDFYRVVDGDR